ncbi:MAG: hypothetical protein V3T88_07930 [Nitrosomonadaceae bacterium]
MTTDTMTTQDMIDIELSILEEDKILFEYKIIGSKWFAVLRLTNGKKARYCPYRRRVTIAQRTYPVKRLKNFLKKNGFEVK